LRKARIVRVLGAVGVLGALTVIGAGGGSATAKSAAAKPGVTKIKIEFVHKTKDLFFDAPASVPEGSILQIKNNTNPKAVGPHSFSLVREEDLPGKSQIKGCEKKLKGICGDIILGWHDVDLSTNPPDIGENPVEVGKNGWDRKGSSKRKGDSFLFLGGKGEKYQREVTAEAGKELYFMCAIHPFMQGEIDVTEAE